MIVLSGALAIIAVILLLPTISDLWSLAWPTAARRRDEVASEPPVTPHILFLIPAHDEELLIDACLDSLAKLRYPRDRFEILVVADNCVDTTAARARQHGVRCLERADAVRRGKPWAVAWALEQIAVADFDAIVILDADSLVDPSFLEALPKDGRAPLNDKIVQGYIDISNPGDSAITRMARVWSAVRFLGINRVKARAALNVPLGDGLCIGTQVLAQHGWTAFSLSETWELYASMTAAGVRCTCAPDARLFAQEARSLRQSGSQRRRWTAGRLAVLFKYGPAIIKSGRIGPHQKLDCVGEMTALGPAAHASVALPLAASAFILPLPGGALIGCVLLGSLLRTAIYTSAAIARDPEPWRAVGAFGYLPIYIVWRLAIQVASILTLGRAQWLRTARHGPSAPQ